MRLVRDLSHTRLSQGSVVTIGNFDGVHVGHQALIERCLLASSEGLERVVITFEPLPQTWFSPATAPGRLTSPRQKIALFAAAGMDLAWMMRFNQELAELPARDFVGQCLVTALRARHVVVGDDFRFGRKREGDLDMLEELGRDSGFTVDIVTEVVDEGGRISSSAVRQALQAGNFVRAAELLGRSWCMEGRVFRGSQLGRTLGYPTANLKLAVSPSPIAGIFAVQARRCGAGEHDWMNGVANLGRRPAVGGGEFLVEVHLFDFAGDLYGQRLEVRFIEKIRDEANFSTLDALKRQMRKDEIRAREILGNAIECAV